MNANNNSALYETDKCMKSDSCVCPFVSGNDNGLMSNAQLHAISITLHRVLVSFDFRGFFFTRTALESAKNTTPTCSNL